MLAVIVAQVSSQKLIGDRIDMHNRESIGKALVGSLPIESLPGSYSACKTSPDPIEVSGDVEGGFFLVNRFCFYCDPSLIEVVGCVLRLTRLLGEQRPYCQGESRISLIRQEVLPKHGNLRIIMLDHCIEAKHLDQRIGVRFILGLRGEIIENSLEFQVVT